MNFRYFELYFDKLCKVQVKCDEEKEQFKLCKSSTFTRKHSTKRQLQTILMKILSKCNTLMLLVWSREEGGGGQAEL